MRKTVKRGMLAAALAALLAVSAFAAEYEIDGSHAFPFDDVAQTDWSYEYIWFANANGLMNGVEKNLFAPRTVMTREMLCTVLYRVSGSPETAQTKLFEDMADGAYYTQAINWAYENGIFTGYDDRQFGIGDPIKREQIVTVLYRYAKWRGCDVSVREEYDTFGYYADCTDADEYSHGAFFWAVSRGIINGTDISDINNMKIEPKAGATREQVAAILFRFLTQYM